MSPGDGAPEVEIRGAPSRRRAEEWALVLETAGLDARVAPRPGGWVVLVPEPQAAAAHETLAAYERDAERDAEENEPPNGRAGAALAAVLVAAYVAAGPREAWTAAFRAGSAVAERIVAGEWWRVVTALTLHADVPHLLGNAFTAFLFGGAVCRALGPGVGAAVVLATGAGGNAVAALVRRTATSSVGASTAIFGAVGVLCGRAAVRAARRRRPGRRPWMAIGAGLALLALLGTSERADLLAHLTGFGVGLPIGAITAETPRAGPGVQWAAGGAAAALLALAWWLALR